MPPPVAAPPTAAPDLLPGRLSAPHPTAPPQDPGLSAVLCAFYTPHCVRLHCPMSTALNCLLCPRLLPLGRAHYAPGLLANSTQVLRSDVGSVLPVASSYCSARVSQLCCMMCRNTCTLKHASNATAIVVDASSKFSGWVAGVFSLRVPGASPSPALPGAPIRRHCITLRDSPKVISWPRCI